MRDKQCKYCQRKINKIVKAMNKNIEEDSLWRGRFYAHQIKYWWSRYSDNSGGEFIAIIKLKDKLTGKEDICRIQYFDIIRFSEYDLFIAMNDFIINSTKPEDYKIN